jgi:hypothetical protein
MVQCEWLQSISCDNSLRVSTTPWPEITLTYIKGQAHLAFGQGTEAAAEFLKIRDHSGMVWNCSTGALAHIGIARANALQAKKKKGAETDAARVRALAAYRGFLELWKSADSDIPIFKAAKAENAKLF